jgi:hypothetical protein
MSQAHGSNCHSFHRLLQHGWWPLLVFISLLEAASGQVLSVPEMLEQRSEWDSWIDSDRKLQIAGRFEGRAGGSFRMQKLDVTFDPPRSLALPRRMLAGQRLEVSGRLENRAGRYHFEVSRLAVGDTDDRRLDERAARIPRDQPALLLNLAAEYQAIADFYNDEDLRDRITSVRGTAFELLRSQAQGDPAMLWDLVQQGKELEIDKREIDAVLFESLHTRYRSDNSDMTELSGLIQKHLPGWDRVFDANVDKLPARYLSEPVVAYRSAMDADRRLMHRQFFRDVQKALFRSELRSDGSNGLEVAARVRSMLPEEEATAAEFEQREIRFRLGQIRQLNRRQLQQLVELLQQYGRQDEVPQTLERWLQRQEQRFAGLGLNGKLRTADEYLFVGDRWSRPQDREQAIALLKEAGWHILNRLCCGATRSCS